MGGLNNRNLFLRVLEPGKYKIKMSANLIFGEIPLPGFQMTAFLLYPHMMKRVHFFSSSKGTNLIHEDSIYWPNYLLKNFPLQTQSHWGLGFQLKLEILGGHKYSFHCTYLDILFCEVRLKTVNPSVVLSVFFNFDFWGGCYIFWILLYILVE